MLAKMRSSAFFLMVDYSLVVGKLDHFIFSRGDRKLTVLHNLVNVPGEEKEDAALVSVAVEMICVFAIKEAIIAPNFSLYLTIKKKGGRGVRERKIKL